MLQLSFSKKQIIVLFCMWLAFISSFVTRLSWPSIMPIAAKELGFPISEAALYISAFYIGYALTVLPGGMLCDKWGYRRIIILCLGAMIAFTLPMYWLNTYYIGLLYRFLLGFFSGPLHAACMSAIGSYFSATQRGTAVGIYMTASSLGITLVNMMTPFISSYYGWRMAFVVISILPALVLVCTVFGLKDMKSPSVSGDENSLAYGEKDVFSPNEGSLPNSRIHKLEKVSPKKEKPSFSVKESLSYVLYNRNILLLALTGLFATGTTWGVVNWANQYMVKQLAVTPLMAGSIMSAFGVAALIAKPISGYVSDILPIGRNKLAAIFLLFLSPMIVLFAYNESPAHLYWLGPLLGVSAFIYSPLTNTLAIQSAPEKVRGTVIGFVNLFNQIGTMTSPILLSQIVVHTGDYRQSLYTIAFFPLMGALFLFMMRLKDKK